MPIVKQYPDGVFSWVDLTTTDVAGAKAFYGGLFGWSADDVPTGDGPDYTMFRIDGHAVAGAGPMDAGMQAGGAPPVWVSYVSHHDIDAVAARASEAGGMVFMPPMDVMEEGRLALVQDPTGAVFGLWQPRNHIGAALVNQPNTLVWNELQTRDTAAARAFYHQVFGWSDDVDSNDYVTFKNDGRAQCGSLQLDESWGDAPPNWHVYFMVDDVDATAARVPELGGTVLMGPHQVGEMGRLLVIRDPQGATFSVMEFDGPVAEPPG
jgi:uncharacterized protein